MNRRDFFQVAGGSVALAAFQDNAIERAVAAGEGVNGRTPQEVARDEDCCNFSAIPPRANQQNLPG